MPVFATLKEIVSLCWRERYLALKFGLIPVVINLALVLAFSEAGEPSFATYMQSIGVGLISVLAFAPFCVAWYRSIIFGKHAVTQRPMFTLTKKEFLFFGWTLSISALVGLVAAIGVFMGAGIVIALSAISPALGVAAGVALVFVGVAVSLMVLSRWSIALAMVAADEPASLNAAWEASKPYGWAMAIIQIIIFAGLTLAAAVLLSGFLPGAIEASKAKADPPESFLLALDIVATVLGAVSLWTSSTLYALVYRRVIGAAQPQASDEATRTAEVNAFRDFMERFRAENAMADPASARAAMDKFGSLSPLPADVTVSEAAVGGVPGRWFKAANAKDGHVILLLHGGGFMVGSSTSHAPLAAALSREAAAHVLAVDYRLAPEHPFPAGIEDCVAAYRGLLAENLKPERIAIVGDSAGGGLVISTLLKARSENLARPACAVCLSPWANLLCDGETYETKKAEDPTASQERLVGMAKSYLNGADTKNELASPYLADLTGLPPLLIQVGTREVLLDDSRKLANAARAVDVNVTLEEWPGMIHGWHLFVSFFTDAGLANARIGAFIRGVWAM